MNENEMANIRHAVSREGASWGRAGCAGSCEAELRTGLGRASLGTSYLNNEQSYTAAWGKPRA